MQNHVAVASEPELPDQEATSRHGCGGGLGRKLNAVSQEVAGSPGEIVSIAMTAAGGSTYAVCKADVLNERNCATRHSSIVTAKIGLWHDAAIRIATASGGR